MLSLVESAKKYGRSADPAAVIQFARNIAPSLCCSFWEIGVFGFGLLVDGHVGVGIRPEIEEGFV
jgi:hypothetical protein